MQISELEKGFRDRCDGDWEHQGGIRIETLDNPGWVVRVDFDTLEIPDTNTVEKYNTERSESDYVVFKDDRQRHALRIMCGVSNLSEALQVLIQTGFTS